MNTPGYDEWKTNTPWNDSKVAFECDHCGQDIYVGDEYVDTTQGDKIHGDCFDEFARMFLISFFGIAEGETE